MMDPPRCLVCKADALPPLKHCPSHSKHERSLPITSCGRCGRPCVGPDSHCVLHGDRDGFFTPFEEALVDYEARDEFTHRLLQAGIGSSPHVEPSLSREILANVEDSGKRRKIHGGFASPALDAFLEAPLGVLGALLDDDREAHIDRMAKLYELQLQRASWCLRATSSVTSDAEKAANPDWIAKAAVVDGSSAVTKPIVCKLRGCSADALPGGATFCLAHILGDSRQTLFKPCTICKFPIFRQNTSGLCLSHNGTTN